MKQLVFSAEKPWLAPLAGWSDLAFRLLCREYGAAVCVTEMVSAKGLVYERENTKAQPTRALLRSCAEDTPLVVQLFGDDASFMAQAIRLLRADGFEWFDCNMGCSVPKVTRTGAGAALLREPAKALELAKAMIAETEPGHVGFKLRLGWEASHPVWQTLTEELTRLGAGWLSLHPRYAKQGFTGQADWKHLAEMVRLTNVPVIASGDLRSAQDGLRCIQTTGVSTVMYARGALNDPMIFAQHQQLFAAQHQAPCSQAEKAALLHKCIKRHAALILQHADQRQGLLKMRTAIPRYLGGFPGIRQLRQDVILSKDWGACLDSIERFFDNLEHTSSEDCEQRDIA